MVLLLIWMVSFLLKAPANATLIISFIGYKTLAVNLEGKRM